MDPNLLEDAMRSAQTRGKLPKAVVVVDLYGECADYNAFADISRRYGVPMIEDAVEELGSTYRDRPADEFGRPTFNSHTSRRVCPSD